jgi:hypothetical protein
MEVSGSGKTVAGVVAHATDDSGALTDEAGHMPAGRFHEPFHRDPEALLSERVDLFDLVASECG